MDSNTKENNIKKINKFKILDNKEDLKCNICNICNICSSDNNKKLLNKKINRIEVISELNNDSEHSENKNDINNFAPINIKYSINLINDSFADDTGLDNIFSVFRSINNILYLIYPNDNQSIILFDLIDNKKINEIKKAHSCYINNFIHYLDKINKRDLILSTSGFDSNIKLWNINNLECLLNIKKVYNIGQLYSACFLYNNNKLFIITCNDNYPDKPDSIKIFDLNGKKIKVIKNSKERSFFIDTFYDKKTDKNYILVSNKNHVKSYDYLNNKLFHKYCDDNYDYHGAIIMQNNNNENITKLIESGDEGNIRIWNFHTAELIKKIEVYPKRLYRLNGMCLWNNEYIFVGCNDQTVKLVNIDNGKIIRNLTGYSDIPLTIKKIIHPLYGECLITKGKKYDMIKIWKSHK